MFTDLTITSESFDSINAYYANPNSALNWNLVFTLPTWLKVWWQSFHSSAELYLRAVRQNDKIIGIAPLQIRNGTASIIGRVNVCDYQDFIVAPGKEKDFFTTVLNDLLQKGVRDLHLETIRPDSTIVTHLVPLAKERQYEVDYHQSDVSWELELPPTWDDYLHKLDGKQRHELNRKLRNLQKMGEIHYRTIEGRTAILEAMHTFLKLFPEYRNDKAEFMTPEMEVFFRSLIETLAETGVVKFGSLESANTPIAMVLYFDYNESVYLYNSAYDPAYRTKSAGTISKARCIQDSIEKGKKRFDFLKGAEPYKSYLGGKELPLYSCHITLKY